jgi:carbamoyl-phosphate synthase large subunit
MQLKNKIKILVTGCGGDIGQSIGKILNEYNDKFELHGFDIDENTPAKFIYNNFELGKLISEPDYFYYLKEFLSENEIGVLLPIAEPELRMYSNLKIGDSIGTSKVVKANFEALEIGFDKYKTYEFLKKEGLPYPKTFQCSDFINQLNFPFILKAKTGSGGKNLFLIQSEREYNFYIASIDKQDYIIQEYLTGDTEEYTCGLYRNKLGEVRNIIFFRRLRGGYTDFGYKVSNPIINELLHDIASKINLVGSINIQLRMVNNIPYVFEINPRFSSTVLFRHMMGFNDVLWSIQDALDLKIDPYFENDNVVKFYKGYSEYID